jgi:hypothetical protein
MSTKATSILRSALLGAAVTALAMAPVAAFAIDQGFAPRPDFPGAKQTQAGKPMTSKSSSKSTSKSHAQRMHGKHHAS